MLRLHLQAPFPQATNYSNYVIIGSYRFQLISSTVFQGPIPFRFRILQWPKTYSCCNGFPWIGGNEFLSRLYVFMSIEGIVPNMLSDFVSFMPFQKNKWFKNNDFLTFSDFNPRLQDVPLYHCHYWNLVMILGTTFFYGFVMKIIRKLLCFACHFLQNSLYEIMVSITRLALISTYSHCFNNIYLPFFIFVIFLIE